jgi:ribonuclease HI
MLKKEGRSIPVYSDSQTAIRWVRDKKVNSKLVRDRSTVEVWELVDRAEKWLGENDFDNELNWWDTPKWGQIRADFNRK